MHIRTSFPFETTHDDLWIPLPDGTLLHARPWRPLPDEPVPALLEYLPYRPAVWTAPRDHQRHPRYAAHGYASVRVDLRGHGNSEGMPTDEYSATELADGVEVVDWPPSPGATGGGHVRHLLGRLQLPSDHGPRARAAQGDRHRLLHGRSL